MKRLPQHEIIEGTGKTSPHLNNKSFNHFNISTT